MKKLFLIVFGLILLVGCRPSLTKSKNDSEPAPIQVTDNIGNIPGFYGVTSFTYNKHDYLVFTLTTVNDETQLCVVHNPDCKKCKNR